MQAGVTVKGTESPVANTPEKTPTSSLRSVMTRGSQRLHTKDEERRSGGGALRPQTDTNTRSRRPFNTGTSSSQADYRRRDESRVARPSRVVEETSPKVELRTTPSKLQVSFDKTDLSRLFSIQQRRSVAESDIGTRIQLLKEHAGDYSRYLPGETDPTSLTVGSVEYAKFILARKRDVELEERHIVVGLMQEAGLNSTSGMKEGYYARGNTNQRLGQRLQLHYANSLIGLLLTSVSLLVFRAL